MKVFFDQYDKYNDIMSEILFTAAMPFKRKGVDSMKENEFIMALSIDLNWFKPATAKAFVRTAVEKGILSRETDMIKAQFNIEDVEIPIGFVPGTDSFEEINVFDQIIERIMVNTRDDKQSIIARINQKKNETGNLFTIEVLGILLAREYGIDVDDLIDRSYKELLRK